MSDVYTKRFLEELRDEDIISDEEEGFMLGYLEE